jgi:ferredoxin
MAREIIKPKYKIVGKLERFDEADNAEARGELEPDSELWSRYYKKHPEMENQGRGLAKLPPMGGTGPVQDMLMVGSLWLANTLLATEAAVDGMPSPNKIPLSPERASEKLKGYARHMGADLVRIGPLNKAWVYSHVGRSHSPEVTIGKPIDLPHEHAIVVAIGLNQDMVKCAPQVPIILETMRAYVRLSSIVTTLARYIRMFGYSARAHDVQNYQVILPPIAIDAGIGELARHGILINEKYGSALKMAAVTTDMPLVHDRPVDIGVDEFCQTCNICARYCPVGAIPMGEKVVSRGIHKWKINDMACYSYMRRIGTDCGVCVAVCPWTRPRNFPHNLVLWGVEHFALARKLASTVDNVIIRRKRNQNPLWLEEQPGIWWELLKTGHPWRR